MIAYILQRVLLSLLITTVAMVALFVMVRMIPGDPATLMLGARASPEAIARLNAQMGLDEPLLTQIGLWFGRIFSGNLGLDIWSQRPVVDVVAEALPSTLALTFAGIGWAVVLGVPLGCYSALRPGTWTDRVLSFASVGAISVPSDSRTGSAITRLPSIQLGETMEIEP